MKTLPILAIALLSTSVLFAQPPEPAPSSELSRLRQGYVDSLNRLLQQYVKSNDVAAASTVSQELDRMVCAAPDALANLSPCGSWRWAGGSTTIITADGMATNAELKTKAVWHWIDESKHQIQLAWQDGFVDTLTVSPDGTKLQGTNNNDVRFSATRLPSPDERVVLTTMK